MDVKAMKDRLLELVSVFEDKESELTELDRAIGDGDHGVNMVRGFKALPDHIDDSSMQNLFKSTGMTLMSNIGGASGPLYGFSFVKMSQVVEDDIDNENVKALLQAFSEAIAQRGKVSLNEKTMYDVIERANEAVRNGEKVDLEKLQSFANATKDIEATKGEHLISKSTRLALLIQGHKVAYIY